MLEKTFVCADGYNQSGKLELMPPACMSLIGRQLSTDLLFLVIRDATGVTQLIAKQGDMDDRQAIGRLKKESVVSVAGTVQRRPETTIKKVNAFNT